MSPGVYSMTHHSVQYSNAPSLHLPEVEDDDEDEYEVPDELR
jgi:hypothetical protein